MQIAKIFKRKYVVRISVNWQNSLTLVKVFERLKFKQEVEKFGSKNVHENVISSDLLSFIIS